MMRFVPIILLGLAIACAAAFFGESKAANLPDIDGAVVDAGMAPR